MKGAKRTREYNVAGATANKADAKFGYVAEKFAALKVMADVPEEGISGPELWRGVAEILDYESSDELSKPVRDSVRSFIQNIKHGRSCLFIGEGDTKARVYKPNPKARVETVIDYTDKDLRDLEAKVQRRLSGKPELSEIDPALVDVEDLWRFLTFINLHGIVAEGHVENVGTTASNHLKKFLDRRGSWIKDLEDFSNSNQGTVYSDEDILEERLQASEKVFNLIDNPQSLETALNQLGKYLEGEDPDISKLPIFEILKALSGFCDDEKQLLKQIIGLRVEQKVHQLGGTFSRGQQVEVITTYRIGNYEYQTVAGNKVVAKLLDKE